MATFPAGKLLKNSFSRKRVSSVIRSDMESGPAKQNLRSSKSYLRFNVTYFFSKSEYIDFDNWVKDTIKFVGVFDWTEPLNNTVITTARIFNGDVSNAEPFNPQLDYWIVNFTIEYLD